MDQLDCANMLFERPNSRKAIHLNLELLIDQGTPRSFLISIAL
jgi:hypothetical protein